MAISVRHTRKTDGPYDATHPSLLVYSQFASHLQACLSVIIDMSHPVSHAHLYDGYRSSYTHDHFLLSREHVYLSQLSSSSHLIPRDQSLLPSLHAFRNILHIRSRRSLLCMPSIYFACIIHRLLPRPHAHCSFTYTVVAVTARRAALPLYVSHTRWSVRGRSPDTLL